MPEDIFQKPHRISITYSDDGSVGNIQLEGMGLDADFTKLPMNFPSFPINFMAPIGAIIVQWGDLEVLHTETLQILIAANGSTKPMPKSFSVRRKRFREELELAIPKRGPNRDAVEDALNRIDEIYWKRNIISHGQFSLRVQVKSDGERVTDKHVNLTIVGVGEINGQTVELAFSMMDLKTLFYEIAHLCGIVADFKDNLSK